MSSLLRLLFHFLLCLFILCFVLLKPSFDLFIHVAEEHIQIISSSLQMRGNGTRHRFFSLMGECTVAELLLVPLRSSPHVGNVVTVITLVSPGVDLVNVVSDISLHAERLAAVWAWVSHSDILRLVHALGGLVV